MRRAAPEAVLEKRGRDATLCHSTPVQQLPKVSAALLPEGSSGHCFERASCDAAHTHPPQFEAGADAAVVQTFSMQPRSSIIRFGSDIGTQANISQWLNAVYHRAKPLDRKSRWEPR